MTIERFTHYEIKRVAEFSTQRGELYCEPLTTLEEEQLPDDLKPQRTFWTLYGRISEGGAEAIGDYLTPEAVGGIYERITGNHLDDISEDMVGLPI